MQKNRKFLVVSLAAFLSGTSGFEAYGMQPHDGSEAHQAPPGSPSGKRVSSARGGGAAAAAVPGSPGAVSVTASIVGDEDERDTRDVALRQQIETGQALFANYEALKGSLLALQRGLVGFDKQRNASSVAKFEDFPLDSSTSFHRTPLAQNVVSLVKALADLPKASTLLMDSFPSSHTLIYSADDTRSFISAAESMLSSASASQFKRQMEVLGMYSQAIPGMAKFLSQALNGVIKHSRDKGYLPNAGLQITDIVKGRIPGKDFSGDIKQATIEALSVLDAIRRAIAPQPLTRDIDDEAERERARVAAAEAEAAERVKAECLALQEEYRAIFNVTSAISRHQLYTARSVQGTRERMQKFSAQIDQLWEDLEGQVRALESVAPRSDSQRRRETVNVAQSTIDEYVRIFFEHTFGRDLKMEDIADRMSRIKTYLGELEAQHTALKVYYTPTGTPTKGGSANEGGARDEAFQSELRRLHDLLGKVFRLGEEGFGMASEAELSEFKDLKLDETTLLVISKNVGTALIHLNEQLPMLEKYQSLLERVRVLKAALDRFSNVNDGFFERLSHTATKSRQQLLSDAQQKLEAAKQLFQRMMGSMRVPDDRTSTITALMEYRKQRHAMREAYNATGKRMTNQQQRLLWLRSIAPQVQALSEVLQDNNFGAFVGEKGSDGDDGAAAAASAAPSRGMRQPSAEAVRLVELLRRPLGSLSTDESSPTSGAAAAAAASAPAQIPVAVPSMIEASRRVTSMGAAALAIAGGGNTPPLASAPLEATALQSIVDRRIPGNGDAVSDSVDAAS